MAEKQAFDASEIRFNTKLKSIRIIAILALVIALLSLFGGMVVGGDDDSSKDGKDFIARIKIEGFIGDDPDFYKLIEKAKKKENIKAVVFWINSPGGIGVGGEELYHEIADLNETKPVVALIRSTGASAAYMAALGADKIFALLALWCSRLRRLSWLSAGVLSR